MLSLKSMVDVEIEKGYNENTAPAKVCQDIVLKAISMGPLHHNESHFHGTSASQHHCQGRCGHEKQDGKHPPCNPRLGYRFSTLSLIRCRY